MAAVLGMTLVLQDTFLTSLPTTALVTSKLDCVSQCYRQANCSSLFYNADDRVCQLVADVYTDDQMDVVSKGMLYFIWTHVTCGSGYTWHRRLNLCYKLHETQMTWSLAATTCEMNNGHLIIVDNADKNRFINTMTEDLGQNIWLGASDTQQEGTWIWSNGSKLNQHFWDAGQPARENTIENCLNVRFYGSNNRWHDTSCTRKLAFVCELSVSENSYC